MSELYSDFLAESTECPFCNGSHNPALAAREHTYLTYAYAPYHKHHMLVVPRRHVSSLLELTREEEEEIRELQHLGLKALMKLGYENITLLVREGRVQKNKTVEHTHYHIVPYVVIGDLDHMGEKRKVMSETETAETVRDLERALANEE